MLQLRGPSPGPTRAFSRFGCSVKTLLSTYFSLHEDNIPEELTFLRRNEIKLNLHLTVVPPRGSRTIGDSLDAAVGY